jgi:hypothetical protein
MSVAILVVDDSPMSRTCYCCAGPCGAAHDRPANLDIPPRRKACRNDDPDADGASNWVGYTC